MNQTMSESEWRAYQQRKEHMMIATCWPRIKQLFSDKKSPKEIVEVLASEGHKGFSCSRFTLSDLHRLQDLAAIMGK